MGFSKKDRSVSGDRIVKNSIQFENVAFVKNEFDMQSNDPRAVPSQQSVVDYVNTYAIAPRVEGDQENPTPLYLTFLLNEAGITVKNNMSILYFYVVNGKRVNSKSLRLQDEHDFTIVYEHDLTTEELGEITNYIIRPQKQNIEHVFGSFMWQTNAGGFTNNQNFTKTNTSMILTNCDVSNWTAKIFETGLEVGKTYTCAFIVQNSNGNGVKVAVGTNLLTLIGEKTVTANGTYSFDFIATSVAPIIMIFGTGSTSCTIANIAVAKDTTTSKTTALVYYPVAAKFTYDLGIAHNNSFSTLTVDNRLGNENTQTSYINVSTLPLVFSIERSASGYSDQDIEIEAEYTETFENSDGDDIDMTGRRTVRFTLAVEEL